MNSETKIEIQLSKSKLIILLVIGIIFMTLGFWFVITVPKVNSIIFGNPIAIITLGIVTILFSLIGLLFVFKKMFDKSPGLTISSEGIIDNASGVGAGFIPWTDVLEINETVVVNKHFINIVVKNPEHYIDRQKNILLKKLVQINYKTYGTVIGIPSVALNCDFKELQQLLQDAFIKFKNAN